MTSEEIKNETVNTRKKYKLPLRGVASSNVRRQLKRLRDVYLVEKIKNDYRITEFEPLSVIFDKRIKDLYLKNILDRVKEYYEFKGYPKDWIDKRLRGIAIRQDLTDEWNTRGVQEEKDFAILTNEISKATFGKTVGEYKQFKGLKKPNQNLRDHMTDWELILTMVGEKATTDITIAKDSKGFGELRQSAKRGGQIADNTRKELEQEIGKPVITKENYLHLAGEKKKARLIRDKT